MQFGKRLIVRPIIGATAMDEYNRIVPPEGAIVRWSSHWQRRLNEGVITVSEIDPPKAESKSKKKTTTTDTEKSK